jgi:hypothetical protein
MCENVEDICFDQMKSKTEKATLSEKFQYLITNS